MEAAQHLEEVYSRILRALHKTARIMCTGYVRAASDIQPIVNAVVQEAVQPKKIYIQSTTGHLSEWGQALHDMLNSNGASAEERKGPAGQPQLAGLKCVQSLLAAGQAFNAAKEHDIEKRLHDTVQAALKVANEWANKTLEKVTSTSPRSSEIRARWPGGDISGFGTPEHGRALLVSARNGDVSSSDTLPCCPGNILHQRQHVRAINNVVPSISAVATSYQAALPTLPALPAADNQGAPSQIQVPKESQETPLKDTPTGRPVNRTVETGTPGDGGGRTSSKQSSGEAPLMKLSRGISRPKSRKYKLEDPGSKRSSSGKKLDSPRSTRLGSV